MCLEELLSCVVSSYECYSCKIAGVKEIIAITRRLKNILFLRFGSRKLAGVDSIYQVGGAQGVAALALGTETIPKVDKITGPGNISWRLLRNKFTVLFGIDMIAGPSEIVLLLIVVPIQPMWQLTSLSSSRARCDTRTRHFGNRF